MAITSAGQSSPAATASPSLSALAPQGKYRTRLVITSTDIPREKVGAVGATTWTITLTCTGQSCTGTILSSSTRKYRATFDGTVLSATSTKANLGPCVYIDGPRKGQLQPGTLASVTDSFTFRVAVTGRGAGSSPAAGVPLRFSGSGTTTEVAKILKVPPGETCTASPVRHDKTTLTLTRIG